MVLSERSPWVDSTRSSGTGYSYRIDFTGELDKTLGLRIDKMLALLLSTPAITTPNAMPRRAVMTSAFGALALHSRSPASAADFKVGGSPVLGDESIMVQKAHGTSAQPVQQNLKWNVDRENADRITNYNRRFAEYGGYWKQTNFLKEVSRTEPTTYYDSVTGKPLFRAPIGRSMEEFLAESNVHGWPSFRDQEVVWENTRVLRDGETVSTTGTHVRVPPDSNPHLFLQPEIERVMDESSSC